ncbi:MAG: hypothetical protein HGA44_18600 [Cellulomonadaceae bacterium]|nr:hypothetical protein [Cellulomonadaceae bacterium]
MAEFTGVAGFNFVTFDGGASFGQAIFRDRADFGGAVFAGDATFRRATFDNRVFLKQARAGTLDFSEAHLKGHGGFNLWSCSTLTATGAVFEGDVTVRGELDQIEFSRTAIHGQLEFELEAYKARIVSLAGAQVHSRVNLGIVRSEVFSLRGAVFNESFRVRSESDWTSGVDLVTLRPGVVEFEGALSLAGASIGATLSVKGVRSASPGDAPMVSQLLSLDGADVRHLDLSEVDMTACVFGRAHGVDELSASGSVKWPRSSGSRLSASRSVIADEVLVRSATGGGSWAAMAKEIRDVERSWIGRIGERGASGAWQMEPVVVAAGDVSASYRSLRHGLEARADEPGAADFYYGETEMRRLDRRRPFSERLILTAYWLVSGYGLRASRALISLILLLVLSSLLMHFAGFETQSTGLAVAAGGDQDSVAFERESTPAPAPGLADALWFSISESTSLLRSGSEVALTNVGRIVDLGLRLLGPVLLALIALAVRARVKR